MKRHSERRLKAIALRGGDKRGKGLDRVSTSPRQARPFPSHEQVIPNRRA